tara:strand:- start:1816 stop:2385 length:570 start_codon:yes stop_codon:yes gene_type:complete
MFYKEQNFNFDLQLLNKDLGDFILERLKNFLKDKQIRYDIVACSTSIFNLDDILKTFKKSLIFNKNIKKNIGLDIVSIYKRSYNILNNEEVSSLKLAGVADPVLFKNEFEKNLYKKINEIKKYFLNIGKEEDYLESLKILYSSKIEVNNFFDNVIVNDDDPIIKKNRLELLSMLCKCFDHFFNFSKIEG